MSAGEAEGTLGAAWAHWGTVSPLLPCLVPEEQPQVRTRPHMVTVLVNGGCCMGRWSCFLMREVSAGSGRCRAVCVAG